VAAPNTLPARAFKPLEQMADHIQADAGTSLLDFSHGEEAGLHVNGGFHQGGLRAARRFHLSGPLFEFSVAATDDGEEEVEPGRELVFAFMPALRTAVEVFVVIFLGLLDEAFEADVTPDFVTVLVKREQREQTRDAAIAIAERRMQRKSSTSAAMEMMGVMLC